MTRHVFISYQHRDQMKAKGFNLMRYNKNVGVDFIGRHLLSSVRSENSDYISRKIREQIKGSSATVILIGRETTNSTWIEREIAWSKEMGKGIVGIKLEPAAEVPEGLVEYGAEILSWDEPSDVEQFDAAIERAIAATGRARNMPVNSSTSCSR